MTDYVSLILRPALIKIKSLAVTIWLRSRGVTVGRGLICFKVPRINLGKNCELLIGEGVQFSGSIDIRVLDGSTFSIGSRAKIDEGVRFVVRNASYFEVKESADIGLGSVFNIGRDVQIGKSFLCAGYCYIQTSSHRIDKGKIPIREAGYKHGEIEVGENCWMGAYSMILGDSKIGDHCVIGANALVRGVVSDGDVVVGQPAIKIQNRLEKEE